MAFIELDSFFSCARRSLVGTLLAAAAAVSPFAAAGCSESRADGGPSDLVDTPLAAHQVDLLAIAYRAASAIPVNPHVKARSRNQATVVTACLELGQERRALEYLAGIDNWLRGVCYADLAFERARRGQTAGVERWLGEAARVAEATRRDENPQEWRRDRIRVRIAQTHLLLGDDARAAEAAAGAVDSEAGKVEKVRAARLDTADFDRQVAAIDQVLATGSLDAVRSALESCVELFDRFHADLARRSAMETRVRTGYAKLPAMIRFDLLAQLTERCLAHQDRDKAVEILAEAERLLGGDGWQPDLRIPLVARLATLHHRAGAGEAGQRLVEAGRAAFEAERYRVTDIDRSDVLRPLAEAYRVLGAEATAMDTYRRALDEAMVNPNSWPRTEDLVAVCLSLARHGVAPDPTLMARIADIAANLRDPW